MEKNLLPKLDINQMHNGLCHPAHLMNSATDALQQTSLVIIPSSSTILDHVQDDFFESVDPSGTVIKWSGIVMPPPRYKTLETASKKRIKSNGKGGKSMTRSPTKNREGARITPDTKVMSKVKVTKKFIDSMALFQDIQEGKKFISNLWRVL